MTFFVPLPLQRSLVWCFAVSSVVPPRLGLGRALEGLQAFGVLAQGRERGDQRQHFQERPRGGSDEGDS